MRVGIQTLPWAACSVHVLDAVRAAQECGYEGVEIAHVIDYESVSTLKNALQDNRIDVAGVSGGSVEQRLKLAQVLEAENKKPPYIYSDDWTEEDDVLYRQSGYQGLVAIHPHMFKPIQTFREASELLQKFDYTRLMPDTAHLTIAGEPVLEIIENHFDRIVAVHLKDWTPVYGRSLPFYSSGFSILGDGRVPIKEVVRLLLSRSFQGWLIVEQDYAHDPRKAAELSRNFLREIGV